MSIIGRKCGPSSKMKKAKTRLDLDGIKQKIKNLFLLKAKFAMTSAVATTLDYVVYLALVNRVFSPVVSNVISYSCGMVLNFILQKRFVFNLQRSVSKAFGLSMLVSFGGMGLSTLIVYSLSQIVFFDTRQYITKIIATGVVFFYNFYLKRYVFEKKFIS